MNVNELKEILKDVKGEKQILICDGNHSYKPLLVTVSENAVEIDIGVEVDQ